MIKCFNSPLPLRAGTRHQYLAHAVQLALGIAEVPGGLGPAASQALPVVSAQVGAHVQRFVAGLRLVRPVAVVHGISGPAVLLVRPVEVLVDVLGIDLARYRRRRRGWAGPLPGGDGLQLATVAPATVQRRFAAQRKCLGSPAVLTSARRWHCYDFLTCNNHASSPFYWPAP